MNCKTAVKLFQSTSLAFSIYIVYGTSSLLNKDLGIPNVYINGSLICLVELLGYFTMFFCCDKIGRKTVNLFCNYTILAATVILLTMDLISNHYSEYSDRSTGVRVVETSTHFDIFFV